MGATLSTHVLDIARGVPAEGVSITLFALEGDLRRQIARRVTGDDGRTAGPLATSLAPGSYELLFDAGAYFAEIGAAALYDEIPLRIRLEPGEMHYHIPLLLGPWGYTTYRGS
jgi:5-hydroxyisourate hydrolase